MPEDPAAYLEKHLIQPVLSELSEQCCRDLPTELTPYLIAKLSEKYPKAAETAAIPAEAKAWTPASLEVYNQKQLTVYLEDLRWAPTLAATGMALLVPHRAAGLPSLDALTKVLHGDRAAGRVGPGVGAGVGTRGGTRVAR